VEPPKKRQSRPKSKNGTKNSTVDDVDAAPSQAEQDAFAAAVGAMIISFAHFEGTLRGIIANITTGVFEDDDLTIRVAALVAGRPFTDLLARLSAQLQIAGAGSEEFEKRVRAWLSAADDAGSKRNRFAHQPLVFRYTKDSGDIEWAAYSARASRRSGFVAHFEPIRIDEIVGLSAEIKRLDSELDKIVDDMLAADLLPGSVRYRLVEVDPDAPPPWQSP
jgi:hypothetical protein